MTPTVETRGTPSHNDYQRRYFSAPERTRRRMAAEPTPYARRHFRETVTPLGLDPGARVLELGCGMGRFSRLLAEAGYRVTAVDLSPDLVEELRRSAATAPWGERVTPVCADSGDLLELFADPTPGGGGTTLGSASSSTGRKATAEPFAAVVGFFFLHHLPTLGPTFAAAAALLAPGGRLAFCEPNAFYLPFYAQILLTPGMTWAGDRGVARMRDGVVLPALRDAGLEPEPPRGYGLFPPGLANRRWGRRLEAGLERLPLPNAFRIFSGRRP